MVGIARRLFAALAFTLASSAAVPAAAEECARPFGAPDTSEPWVVAGTLTGFGSICVNGGRIEIDEGTAFFRDGLRARFDQLGLGQVVRVELPAGQPATRIDIDYAIAGPAESVRVAERSLSVLGIDVVLEQYALIRASDGRRLALHELRRGDHVEVSGLRRGAGSISASRIDLVAAGSPSHVTGVAVPVGHDTMYVGRVRGRTADALGFDRTLRGRRIQMRGKWDPRRRVLSEALVRRRPLVGATTRRASIEGHVIAGEDSSHFALAETPFTLENATPDEVSLPVDSRVHVAGQIEGTQLRLERITLVERSEHPVKIVLPPPGVPEEPAPPTP